MDRIDEYRKILLRILGEHLEIESGEEGVETLAVCDDKGGHYLLLEIGWQGYRRIYSVVFHLRLKDSRIWIEQDWTEYGVARELVEAGVPQDAIILGFQPLEMRPYVNIPSMVTA